MKSKESNKTSENQRYQIEDDGFDKLVLTANRNQSLRNNDDDNQYGGGYGGGYKKKDPDVWDPPDDLPKYKKNNPKPYGQPVKNVGRPGSKGNQGRARL